MFCRVGKMLSTKKADGLPIPENFDDCEKFRDDITSQYKYLEGNNAFVSTCAIVSYCFNIPNF